MLNSAMITEHLQMRGFHLQKHNLWPIVYFQKQLLQIVSLRTMSKYGIRHCFDEKLFNITVSVHSVTFCCSARKLKNFID